MTTLVAFVAIDPNGPSAFYLASDSRITWGTPHKRWDAGRKLFASIRHPHAFGYAGDVVFPSLVLTQLVELIDTGSMFSETDTCEEEHLKIFSAIQSSFQLRQNAPDENFSILHVSRQKSGNESNFALWQISFDKNKKDWTDDRCEIPTKKSSLAVAIGTGANSIKNHEKSWRNSAQGGTSRSIYAAFIDSLKSGGDPVSGGAPQLVGIYREGHAKSIAVIHKGERYFGGLPVPDTVDYAQLDWRDDLFQRMDGKTMNLLDGAQRHARPKM